MKKVLLLAFLLVFASPVLAEEFTTQGAEASRFFNPATDSRFQYDLPSKVSFPLKKDSKPAAQSDDSEITLDPAAVKPVRKVIKRIEDTPADANPAFDSKDVPMNYDSFPKFYDNNNMLQQQFMPAF